VCLFLPEYCFEGGDFIFEKVFKEGIKTEGFDIDGGKELHHFSGLDRVNSGGVRG
jgi:hypothetical protein